MTARYPVVAGMFYPGETKTCRRQVTECLEAAALPEITGSVLGGVAPHAGWTFSGPTAARTLLALGALEPPETIILFGAVHRWGVDQPCLYGAGAWHTPLGDVQIDQELATGILAASSGLALDRPDAHDDEHSIEVQLPFIKHLYPQTRILPIAMPPVLDAIRMGRTSAIVARQLGRRAVAVGSSDLTHYGPRYGFAPVGVGDRALAWTHENDARLLDLVENLRADDVIAETRAHHNACGAGAIAAAIAFAAELGAKQGLRLHYTPSHEVMPMGRPTDMVGYGAVVFI